VRRVGPVARRIVLLIPVIGIASLVFGAADAVYAQTIEEIVVTARKKEESLQDVPISIAAFTGEQMRQLGIRNNYDVAAFTPRQTSTRCSASGVRAIAL